MPYTVRYTNEHGQTFEAELIRMYGDYLIVKRPEWYAEEAIRPEDYASCEVLESVAD